MDIEEFNAYIARRPVYLRRLKIATLVVIAVLAAANVIVMSGAIQ